MKKVVITGSYAVGKSNILNLLQELENPIFNADIYVGNLYRDKSFQDVIVHEIEGLDVFDKERLADLIYSNEKQRKKIESIIHPMVIKEANRYAAENSNKNMVFFEIPLLFEAGLASEFDISICVYCDEKTRQQRATRKKDFSQERYEKLSEIQLSQETKKRYADYVIDSSQEKDRLKENIQQIVEQIKNG